MNKSVSTAGKVESDQWHAPDRNGDILVSPSGKQLHELLSRPQVRDCGFGDLRIDGLAAAEIAWQARNDLFRMAHEWTSRYRSIEPWQDVDPVTTPILLAGHQPGLFHPGVWFKNFVLDRLAKKTGAIAINLIVDNDLGEFPAVAVPFETESGFFSRRLIHYDTNQQQSAVELQQIQNVEMMKSFPSSLADAVAPWISKPVVTEFWRHVLGASKLNDNPGYAIACGRHAFEAELGLRTLEVPLSQICRSISFHHFFTEIIRHAGRFAESYNRHLDDFREQNGIRSPSHPVPPLAVYDGWTELPFWIYSQQDPTRRRMMVQSSAGSIRVSPAGLESVQTFGLSDLARELEQWQATGICIRPRVLMTTLFARMFLGDLFIHGIGGAVYDQITNRLAADFFGTELPQFLVATATFRLIDWSPKKSQLELKHAKQVFRTMEMHPEDFLDPAVPENSSLIQAKRNLVPEMAQADGRRSRHGTMRALNHQLRDRSSDQLAKQEDSIRQLESDLSRDRIIGSRELSFCLHDAGLPERLLAAADRAMALN